MADSPSEPCVPLCVRCDYDLSTLNTRRCPECGYFVTDEDIALDSRRRIYIESSRILAWIAPAGIVIVGLLTGVLDFLAVLLLAALAYAGGWFISRRLPLLQRRVFRRAWCVSSLYWFLPLLLFQAASPWLIRWFELDYSFAYMPPYSGNRFRWSDPPILIAVKIALLAVSIPLWYFGWRRASRLAGVPHDMRTRRIFRNGVLAVIVPLAPPAAIILLGAIIGAAMWILDRFFPGWEMGR